MKAMLARNLKYHPDVDYISYIMQQKFDGDRVLFIRGVPYNRNGDPYTKVIPAGVQHYVNTVFKFCVVDGELVGDTYHAFDMVLDNGIVLHDKEYKWRYGFLKASMLDASSADVVLSKNYYAHDPEEFRHLGWEGVILRAPQTPYTEGRTNNLLKHKFVERADVVILAKNSINSVSVGVHNGGDVVYIGNVNMWPHRNKPEALELTSGDVIEVEYLYCVQHDDRVGMVQAQFKNTRPDKKATECDLSQLKIIPSRATKK